MPRYEAKVDTWLNEKIIVLKDKEYGAEAAITSNVGNNLFRLILNKHQVIQGPTNPSELKTEPTKHGVPILFPPNRIRNGTFKFGEKIFHFPLNHGIHHIHGEINSRPWDVIDLGINNELGAFITSEFKLLKHPDILAYFPYDLVFRLSYFIKDGELGLHGYIYNKSPEIMPFAFGLHPYFSIPIDRDDDIEVVIPAKSEWGVNSEGFVDKLSQCTPFCQELNKGLALSKIPPRVGYNLVTLQNDKTQYCKIIDYRANHQLIIELDDKFPFMVVFRPIWSSAISLEPYTSVTDAFNLDSLPHETGLIGLKQNDKFQFQIKIRSEKIQKS